MPAYVPKIDRKIVLAALLMLLIGFVCSLYNSLFVHYPGNAYVPFSWKILLPIILLVLLFTWRFGAESPRLAFFTRFYTLYFIVIFSMGMMVNGIQYTPFQTIDTILAHFDKLFGVNTPALLNWLAQYPWLRMIFSTSYMILSAEVFFVPLLLTLLNMRRELDIYLLVFAITFVIGGLIYYFFPTASPVSIFSSGYFSQYEQATYLKFFQIHHYIQPANADGGLIAFPSFHVIYAVICTLVFRRKSWIFYPLLGVNLIALCSTVFLGAHYFMDVIAGLIIASSCYFYVNHSFTKLS